MRGPIGDAGELPIDAVRDKTMLLNVGHSLSESSFLLISLPEREQFRRMFFFPKCPRIMRFWTNWWRFECRGFAECYHKFSRFSKLRSGQPKASAFIKHKANSTAQPFHVTRNIFEQIGKCRIAQFGLNLSVLHLFDRDPW